MRTVKDVSLLLDVSTTTVYNHIEKLGNIITPYIFDVKGVQYLNDEGIRQLKLSLGQLQVPVVEENISTEDIIKEISLNISEDIREDLSKISIDSKTNYQNLKDELDEIKEQSNIIKQQHQLIEDQNKEIDELRKQGKIFEQQSEEIKEHSKLLIEMVQDKRNKTLFNRVKTFFS